jgi:hypothetical protein
VTDRSSCYQAQLGRFTLRALMETPAKLVQITLCGLLNLDFTVM